MFVTFRKVRLDPVRSSGLETPLPDTVCHMFENPIRFPLRLASQTAFFLWFAWMVPAVSHARTWTDVDGRKIEAELLEIGKSEVTLKLANGKTAKVPYARLSADDKAFVLGEALDPRPKGAAAVAGNTPKCKGFEAFWPSAAQCSLDLKIDVVSEEPDKHRFIYHSAHFEFICNAQLRPKVVSAFASLFEATHEFLRVLPLNNRLTATPTKLRVVLFDSMEGYLSAGGPPGSAGVCSGSGARSVILVPLESLGVRKVPGKDEFGVDAKQTNTVLAHELTHALMEDEVKAASWYIEGSAEYVRLTPFTTGRYRIAENRDAIVAGVTGYGKRNDGGRALGKKIAMPPLSEFMEQPYPIFVANPQFNYGMATLLTYYFYHLDGRRDAARIKAYVQALQSGEDEPDARKKLLDGREWSQLEAEFSAAMKSLGLTVTFGT